MESLTDVVLLSNGEVGPLTKNECQEIVKKYLGRDNFEIVKVTIAPRSENLIGFMSEHWKIEISVKTEEKVEVSLKFFAKTIPVKIAEHVQFVSSSRAYEKETKWYLTVLNDFQKHYDKTSAAGVTGVLRNRTSCAVTCECFYIRPDIIVLEDLSVAGFKCLNARIPMDLEHCKVVLQTMARFHAASILYEDERGEDFRLNELYPEIFFETLFTAQDSSMRDWLLVGRRSILAVVELMMQTRTKLPEKFQEKFDEAFFENWEWMKPSRKYRNVACHGDLWSGNIQFRYDEEQGTPVEVRLVDFQLGRYLPPAHDVTSFLHFTTTRGFRTEHLETLLDVYYETLDDVLLRQGVVLDRFLSRPQFRESCDAYKLSAVLMCCTYFPAIIDDKAIDLFESSEKFKNYARVDRNERVTDGFNNDPVIKARLTDVVEEMIDMVLFKQ